MAPPENRDRIPPSAACTPDAASRPKADPPDRDEGIDSVDGVMRFEKISLARARGAAEHLHRSDCGLIAEDGCHAGLELCVIRVADFEPCHVCDQVARPGAPCRH
jgi:hypothetical protein